MKSLSDVISVSLSVLRNAPDRELGCAGRGEKCRLNWHIHIWGNGNVSVLLQRICCLVGKCCWLIDAWDSEAVLRGSLWQPIRIKMYLYMFDNNWHKVWFWVTRSSGTLAFLVWLWSFLGEFLLNFLSYSFSCGPVCTFIILIFVRMLMLILICHVSLLSSLGCFEWYQSVKFSLTEMFCWKTTNFQVLYENTHTLLHVCMHLCVLACTIICRLFTSFHKAWKLKYVRIIIISVV